MIDILDVEQVIDLPIQIVYQNEFQYFNILNHFYKLHPELKNNREKDLQYYNSNKIFQKQSLIITSDGVIMMSKFEICSVGDKDYRDYKISFNKFEEYKKLITKI